MAADRARAIVVQQNGAASAAGDLLASLASRLSDSFADKGTIVGSLSAAQADFTIGDPAQPDPSKTVHKATTPFALTLASASLPTAASLPAMTLAKATASYASDAGHQAAA